MAAAPVVAIAPHPENPTAVVVGFVRKAYVPVRATELWVPRVPEEATVTRPDDSPSSNPRNSTIVDGAEPDGEELGLLETELLGELETEDEADEEADELTLVDGLTEELG